MHGLMNRLAGSIQDRKKIRREKISLRGEEIHATTRRLLLHIISQPINFLSWTGPVFDQVIVPTMTGLALHYLQKDLVIILQMVKPKTSTGNSILTNCITNGNS